jgi:hypothetical protein
MGIKARALEAAAEAVATGDEDAKESARALMDDFTKWSTTREYALKERKRCNENVQAKLAALKEAMETGHNNESQQLLKLTVVEERWQDLEEARVERKELMASCRDQVKLCETRIRERIEALKSPQLGLFTTSTSTIDNPPTTEDDDPEDAEDGTTSKETTDHNNDPNDLPD